MWHHATTDAAQAMADEARHAEALPRRSPEEARAEIDRIMSDPTFLAHCRASRSMLFVGDDPNEDEGGE